MKRVLLLVPLIGCATVHYGLPMKSPRAAEAYNDALAAYTRTARVDERLSRLMTVVATYQTPAFVEARLNEEARFRSLDAAAVEALRARWKAENPGPSVVLFLDATDPDWEDLSGRTPTFRVALSTGELEWDAVDIVTLDRDHATYQHLFPYVGRFGQLYLVRFPAGAPETGADILIAGPPVQLTLAY